MFNCRPIWLRPVGHAHQLAPIRFNPMDSNLMAEQEDIYIANLALYLSSPKIRKLKLVQHSFQMNLMILNRVTKDDQIIDKDDDKVHVVCEQNRHMMLKLCRKAQQTKRCSANSNLLPFHAKRKNLRDFRATGMPGKASATPSTYITLL